MTLQLSIAVAVGLALLSGCADKHMLYAEVGENPVVFESPAASETFRHALMDRYDAGEAEKRQYRLSVNAFFNRQIGEADADADGIITDAEASAYAGPREQ